MPTITIDGKQITVPEGTNVLEAAKAADIVIPHFCYHEALGAVGACRLCAMTFLEGPVKGVQMSCMVKAQDGMVVSTLEKTAETLRSRVIEWLMMNHPHDCPVCDEGGECQLQDMTIAGGHAIRRYEGLKRTYNNQFLGPFVYQEMNRCIQCYRCVRTYQDYCGGTDFGVMGANQRIFFGRFKDGPLESTFSGNIVDACPTGVFTDKTFRFQSRYWDLQEAPSVCPHCSLGCAVIPGARYRELQRVRGGVNRQTNGFFICDRGRFSHGYANHPDRPRTPCLAEHPVSWKDSISAVRTRISDIAEEYGPRSIALLGSSRSSLESSWLLKEFARTLETDRIAFEAHPGRDHSARLIAARLGNRARSQEEIRRSDCIVLLGVDPANEGPMLSLAVRQAVRQGAFAAILDPRPVKLPFEATHLSLSPERLGEAVAALGRGEFKNLSRREAVVLEGVRARIEKAQRPVLVGGGDLLEGGGLRQILAAVEHFSEEDRPCGAAFLLGGPNSFGAALLSREHPDFERILEEIEKGAVKALLCMESDPFGDYPDPTRVRRALSQLELLITLDYLPTEAVRRADLFLPLTAPAESQGTYVNYEGRMQAFTSVFAPGVPIRVTGGGSHPPRTFEPYTPGSEPRPGWQVLSDLLGSRASLEEIRREIETGDERFAGLSALDPEGEGQRVHGSGILPREMPSPVAGKQPEGTLRLLSVPHLFGSEVLASFAPSLDPARPEPYILLHPEDAAERGLAAGETVRLIADHGELDIALHLSEAMAPGMVIVPHLRGTPLEVFVPGASPGYGLVEKGGGL